MPVRPIGANDGEAPRRPEPAAEARASWLLARFSPSLPKVELEEPPAELAPYEQLRLIRPDGGSLAATFFPALGPARGGVLLVHPWLPWGRAYFHRRGRIEALREAGYCVLSFDFGGVGGSDPQKGFFERDIALALDWLRQRGEGLPLHLWGVSAGGYWSHMVLTQGARVLGVCFEDVTVHLLEWSRRRTPLGRPFYYLYRRCLPEIDHYLDLRAHAPYLRAQSVTYIGGEEDRGALPADTRVLAELARGECHLFPAMGHLESIKEANATVLALALGTFARAERAS